MIEQSELEQLVRAAFPGAAVHARDLTGGRDHYHLVVVSPAFSGKSTLERHRLIYAPLSRPLEGPLHALTIQALTPDEAEQQGGA